MAAASPKQDVARGTPLHDPGSPLAAIVEESRRIATTPATVLLTGETGTGKEVFARYVHLSSGRPGRFVSLNCGAIPESLVESELFGHARGAFTGAQTARRGRVALAQNGTLFLDEIGELKPEMQVKLLRLLQERTYEPVGSDDTQRADFRLIAATNRDLAEEVAKGRFRADLYYRLLVCPLHLPPLRERAVDVPILVSFCWANLGEKRQIAADVMDALQRHDWPGNVRELENLVERLSVCSVGERITFGDLPESYRRGGSSSVALRAVGSLSPEERGISASERDLLFGASEGEFEPSIPADLKTFPIDLPALLREMEDRYIEAALAETQGNKQAAADLLGLRRTTLVEKLRRRGSL